MIQEMAKQSIITGYQDGTFKPNAPIQRQHAVLILTRVLELEPKKMRKNLTIYLKAISILR